MFWNLVDVIAIAAAFAIVVAWMPGRIAGRWRRRVLERMRDQSKASPRRGR